MGIYSLIYYNLCQSKSQLKESWQPGSNIHRHHIIPKHSGGIDDDSNYTYLTIREHIIAHFLLWKIHKNPNDLRSMKMLGANLTYEQRRIVGLWCKENKIGFHNPEVRKEAQQKGLESQKQKNTEDTFYYWSTKEGRKNRASLGGKASIVSPNNPWSYWASEEGQKKRASLGGQSHKGKRCMYKPGDKTFKRVRPEDIQSYLNEGYIFGSPHPTKNHHSSSDI
jgi:hypothetical protein